MRTVLGRLLIVIALVSLSHAQYFAFNGSCSKGGQAVVTQGLVSTGTTPLSGGPIAPSTGVLGSYPLCQVSVYFTGTTSGALIYSDAIGTPLTQPFTANADGSFLFYAAALTGYDVTMAGGGLPAPVTLTDVFTAGAGAGVGFYQFVKDDGALQTQRPILNLISGTGVTVGCVDNAGLTQTDCTLSSPGGVPAGSNQQIQLNQLGVFGAVAGLTSDSSGNVLVPGTIGITGQTSGTTGVFTGNVTALSFTTTGSGAFHAHSAFGATQATPIAGQNGITFITGSGALGCYVNGGSVSTCSIAGGLVANPASDQSVVQPSTGGSSVGTSLNSNVFEQVRYADQFAWSQSPSGTISIGANTIAINAVRGISQYSFSPGVNNSGSFSFVVHKLRIAGTGTPEVVTLTGSTCTGASSGTCTLTFTATNSHSAGYTIGTATAGFQEAIVDTFPTSITNPVSGWTVKASPYSKNHNITIYGSINFDEILGSVGGLHLDCEGATLEDAVPGAGMIVAGGNHTSANIWPSQTLIDHCHFAVAPGLGRAANGTQVYIWDRSQSLTVAHNNWDGALQSPCTDCVDTLVLVAGDQHFTFDKNVINNPPMKCDLTWCGAMVIGDHTNNAAIGAFYDNYMNGADAIEWDSHNGMTLHGNVFQNWIRYPWRYESGLAGLNDLGGNYYEGNCGFVNPDFGVTGYSCNTGRQVAGTGTIGQYAPGQDQTIGVIPHSFSGTGASVYNYYIVGVDGSGHKTRALFVGTASTDGVTNFNVLFLKFGATSYDVLRSGPNVNDGTDAAPWGTGNWAVATGITCSVNPCTYTETFAAPTSYVVLGEAQSLSYCPSIPYWPVPLFLQGCGTPQIYIGPSINGFVSSALSNSYTGFYDAIFTSEVGGPGAITGMHILRLDPSQISASAGNKNPGAMILNPDAIVNNMSNRKGRLLFTGLASGGIFTNNLMVQTYDSVPNKTLATSGNQPFLDPGDIGFGYDLDKGHQATMCGSVWCDWYINTVPDSGTSRKMRLTGTALDLPTGSVYSINGVTLATPSTYNAAGTQQVNAHMIVDTCTLGTSCAVTLVGPAVFTGSTSYTCNAEDQTAAAATKVVQSSGSAFTITGTGTDVLRYTCVGN